MAHANYILHNLEIYDKAQAKLKIIHRKLLNEKSVQFNAFVRLSDDEGILAMLFKPERNDRLRVIFWRYYKGEAMGDEGFNVSYTEFMLQYPEFGRRLLWKENSWEFPEFDKWAEPFKK